MVNVKTVRWCNTSPPPSSTIPSSITLRIIYCTCRILICSPYAAETSCLATRLMLALCHVSFLFFPDSFPIYFLLCIFQFFVFRCSISNPRASRPRPLASYEDPILEYAHAVDLFEPKNTESPSTPLRSVRLRTRVCTRERE